jgi:hypothetical protein
VVPDVLVTIGHHCAPAIPPALADDMHLSCEEGVGGAHDTSNVEVVLPVLDCDVKPMTSVIEVSDDRSASPVPVPVDNIAPVA